MIDSGTDVTTEFAHDGLDRLTLVTYDAGGLAIENTIEYDDAGREVTRTDGLGQATVYNLRPELDVVEVITYADDANDPPDNEVFDHDRRGLVLKHWRAVDLDDLLKKGAPRAPSGWPRGPLDPSWPPPRSGRRCSGAPSAIPRGESATSSKPTELEDGSRS